MLLRKYVMGLLLSLPGQSAFAQSTQSVLVFGGSGRLGSEVVSALLAADHQVTVFVRASSNRSRLEGMDVSFFVGDVLVLNDVQSALKSEEFDVVVDALSRGNAPAGFYETSMAHISQAASAQQVRQIILHGSVGAGDSAATVAGFGPGMRRVMEAKTAAENALRTSGVAYTVIRNWAIKPHGTPATGNAMLTEDINARSAVTRADLAQLTVRCVAADHCMNKIFHAVDDFW